MRKTIEKVALSVAWLAAWLPIGMAALYIGLRAIWVSPKAQKPPTPAAPERKDTEPHAPSTSSETTNRSAMTADDWNKVSLVDMRREGNA